jgi:hypothetical protein
MNNVFPIFYIPLFLIKYSSRSFPILFLSL